MTDPFDQLVHDSVAGYNAPGEPDREAMWKRIQHEREQRSSVALGVPRSVHRNRAFGSVAAAALLLATGIGIGRATAGPATDTPRFSNIATTATRPPGDSVGQPSAAVGNPPLTELAPAATTVGAADSATSSRPRVRPPRPIPAAIIEGHLALSAELISAFRTESASGVMDVSLTTRSTDLLNATRRLEDLANGGDPSLQKLLSDLDLVLVQIAQYSARASTNQVELDLIEDSIRRRGILAELRMRVRPQPSPLGTENGS